MDWKTILLLVVSVMLLVVWLPMLYISIRKVLRHDFPGQAEMPGGAGHDDNPGLSGSESLFPTVTKKM